MDIADSFRALSLDSSPLDPGFQGKSSAAMLVKAAVTVKPRRENLASQIYRSQLAPKPGIKSWNHLTIPPHRLSFPDDYLLKLLVTLYFSNIHPFMPVLHHPTFEEDISQQLHMHNPSFGSLLLLVCALGSLYLTEPAMASQDRRALGWKWYNQVELCGHSLSRAPIPSDIQAYCLAVQFLISTSDPRTAWAVAGFGMRLAQDLGSHRHKTLAPTITIHEDLEKRAFWMLSFLDDQLSAALGRAAVLDPVEIDVGLPSQCDDEHWQPWGLGFQPRGKPSKIVFFNCLVNLYRILHFLLRVFYTIHLNNVRLKRHPDLGCLAVELDSVLDKWFSDMPQHLIWDPNRPDGIFFDQSAALHCFYYYTRILLHRPFIPGISSMIEPNGRASGICTEAARACINVANVQHERRRDTPLFFSQSPVFTSAMILILTKWATTNELSSQTDHMALVHKSISILKSQQERWPSSEFFVTVLERLDSLDKQTHQSDDHQNTLNTEHSAVNSNTNFPAWPTRATPSTGLGSSSQLAPSNAKGNRPLPTAIPLVFIGDEEIIPRKAYRRPVNI
ncbi:fungal-specific transcription factor domain-containing protein [Mycena capillaripes]|nr:fungal-specific transcription factor domain-containing protein [Mycena capillaripes]